MTCISIHIIIRVNLFVLPWFELSFLSCFIVLLDRQARFLRCAASIISIRGSSIGFGIHCVFIKDIYIRHIKLDVVALLVHPSGCNGGLSDPRLGHPRACVSLHEARPTPVLLSPRG